MRSVCTPLLVWSFTFIAYRAACGGEIQGREHDQVEAALKGGLLQLWFPRCLDHENGGFLCDFDSQGRPAGRQPKSIVFQGRMTWLASRDASIPRHFPDDPRHYRELFSMQWKFIQSNVIDPEHGGWYPTSLDSGGDPKAAKGSEWKAGYHDGRALMNAVDWLGQR